MVIYVDVLLFLNIITDYLLISLSAYILGRKVKTVRLIFVSICSSLISLVILLPYLGAFLELVIKILSASVVSLLAFGIKKYIKSLLTVLMLGIVFNGIMTAIWLIFKPNGMVLNNSVVYFNISPFELIIASVVSYLVIKCVMVIIRRNAPMAQRCNVTLYNKNKMVSVIAMIDTGNSLKDVYTGKHVVITDAGIANELLGDFENLPKILLPYKTMDFIGTVPAYQIDGARINNRDFRKLLLAVCNLNFDDDFKIIINPEMF